MSSTHTSNTRFEQAFGSKVSSQKGIANRVSGDGDKRESAKHVSKGIADRATASTNAVQNPIKAVQKGIVNRASEDGGTWKVVTQKPKYQKKKEDKETPIEMVPVHFDTRDFSALTANRVVHGKAMETGNNNMGRGRGRGGRGPIDPSNRLYGSHAREVIPEIIKSYPEPVIDHIKEIASAFLNELNKAPNPGAKAKLLEVVVAYHFWELLEVDEVFKMLQSLDVREKDGHSALHWVNWPASHKRPIAKLLREQSDALKTIEVLYNAQYSPIDRNYKNETVIDSLNEAIKMKYIPEEWREKMEYMYTHPSPRVADTIIRKIGGLITPQNYMTYGTTFCWVFAMYPAIAIKQVIRPCMLLDVARKTPSGHWDIVTRFVKMYKKMIEAGPNLANKENKDYLPVFNEYGWNTQKRIDQFNNSLGTKAASILAYTDMQFPDPLAGVVGECDVPEIQEKYMITCLESTNENGDHDKLHLAIYCLSHSKNFDTDVMKKFVEKFDKFATKDKYMLTAILEEALDKKIATQDAVLVELKMLAGMLERPMKKVVSSKHKDELPDSWEDELDEDLSVVEVTQLGPNITLLDKLEFMRGLSKMSDHVEVSTESSIQLVPQAADDIAYGLQKLFQDQKLNHAVLLENVLIRAMECIRTHEQLTSFCYIMRFLECSKVYSREDIVEVASKFNTDEMITELSDIVDPPTWISPVVSAFVE
jgi:hypothetical protein